MTIDQLIKRLQFERLRHGNIEVVLEDGLAIQDIATFEVAGEKKVWLSVHEIFFRRH